MDQNKSETVQEKLPEKCNVFIEPPGMVNIPLSSDSNTQKKETIYKKIHSFLYSLKKQYEIVLYLTIMVVLIGLLFIVLGTHFYSKEVKYTPFIDSVKYKNTLNYEEIAEACKFSLTLKECCLMLYETIEECNDLEAFKFIYSLKDQKNLRKKRQAHHYDSNLNMNSHNENNDDSYQYFDNNNHRENKDFIDNNYDLVGSDGNFEQNEYQNPENEHQHSFAQFNQTNKAVLSENTIAHVDSAAKNPKIMPTNAKTSENNTKSHNFRISQEGDFLDKPKIDSFGTNNINQGPCIPISQFRASPFDGNQQYQAFPIPGPNSQQPLYMINPSHLYYPYMSQTYAYNQQIPFYPMYPQLNQNKQIPQMYQTYFPTSTNQNGQYFICNPLTSTSTVLNNQETNGNNGLLNIPGVEVRRSNLQEVVASSYVPTNNKTREAIICPIGLQSCMDGSKCIRESHFCDNVVNCIDGSDEMFCKCKDRVGKFRHCDAFFDCPNGEDELGCFGCKEDEFSCDDWSKNRDGTCIPLSQRCDGKIQCSETKKDEEDCSVLSVFVSPNAQSLVRISNTEGFLLKNYKGKWYPSCNLNENQAMNLCNSEGGPIDLIPKAHMSLISYDGPFIKTALDGTSVELTKSCDFESTAAYFQCPPMYCGFRTMIKNSIRSTEVDISEEDILGNSEGTTKSEEIVGISRVVGGKPCQPASWPWIVSIYKNGLFHCGGVIINKEWILTASHCTEKYWFFHYEIQVGILRRASYSPMEQTRWAKIIVSHAGYNRRSLNNDIALIKLSAPLNFNKYVRPICLPSEITGGRDFMSGPAPNTICTTVGWGATEEHGADPDHLREVEIPILKSCKHSEDLAGDEVCAGLSEGGRDACQGDSGGPLMCRSVNNQNQWYLVGIVSHGEGCARPNEPGVYTKVSRYLDWIMENTKTGERDVERVPLQNCPGYKCHGTEKCLPKNRLCDKIVDCLLGDDETDCLVRTRNLPEVVLEEPVLGLSLNRSTPNKRLEKRNNLRNLNHFRCKTLLQIIPSDKRCDKKLDCEDGSDEIECSCIDYLEKYNQSLICDGIIDCKDFSDEMICDKCSSSQYHCRESNQCIDIKKRCDSFVDCTLNEDESECVALTNGDTLTLDKDLRPRYATKGIVTINRNGEWKQMCVNDNTDDVMFARKAEEICNDLEFSNYITFKKIPHSFTKSLDVTLDGFPKANLDDDNNLDENCTTLFIRCSNKTMSSKIEITNTTTSFPWSAVIFANGEPRCVGIIIDPNWIIASIGCLNQLELDIGDIVALVGISGRIPISLESIHEESFAIISWKKLDQSLLLKTNISIKSNRYIQVTPIQTRSVFSEETCIALAYEQNKVQSVFLKSETSCTIGFRCFKSEFNINHDINESNSWNGVIVCKSRDSWYPAALFNNLRGRTDFNISKNYTSLSFNRINIIDAIRQNISNKTVHSNCNRGFKCAMGQCIEKFKICDGVPDCRSGEDEDSKLCNERDAHCHLTNSCACLSSEMKCKNGKCVPKSAFCDSINDCGDHSDEPAVCTCKSYLELSHPEKICDGRINCMDRSDEDPSLCTCDVKRVQCSQSKHQCVSKEALCDNVKDCPDGEDEKHCYALHSTLHNEHSVKSGEVLVRTSGNWQSACVNGFHANMTETTMLGTSTLESICVKLGFSGASARRIEPPVGSDDSSMRPFFERFEAVWLRRTGSRKLRMWMRKGNEPYVRLTHDKECHKLFLECL